MDANQVEVDLHILVVPDSQWRPDLRLAYSNTCMASVSAGFVRVDPNVSLDGLRGEISKQLDSTSVPVPQSFIFLRSVGRHLCTVSRSQELTLTSRHFAPPLAVCPEIYLLNASLTMYDQQTTEEVTTHLPKHHYSPHTSGQLYTSPLAHTRTVSDQFSYLPYDEHGQGAVVSPIIDKPTHQTDVRSNLAKLSAKSMKMGIGRDHHTNSLFVSPDVLGSKREQNHDTATLGYQPQDDSEAHRSRLHISENQATGNDGHCNDKLQPDNTQSVQSRSVQKVHFESPTHVSVASLSTTSDTTTRLSPSPHSLFPTHSASASSPSSQPHEIQFLLVQIRRVKEESKHLSILKENLSSTVRQLQQKLKARREKDDSEWKHKFAQEKKQTRTLEKSLRKLNVEIEADDKSGAMKKPSVKKSVASGDHHRDSRSVPKSESNHTNMKLECRRADVDMENLRKTLEDEEQKLKLEQEKHHSITDECKILKKELNQLKIAHNREKKPH